MFTVEDGSGRADSNAYIDVSYADAHHDDRGNTAWTGEDAAKGAAIIKATAYLGRWDANWKGWRTTTTQALAWPRMNAVIFPRPYVGLPSWSLALYGFGGISVDAFPQNAIPPQLKQATAELALRALTGKLSQDQKRGGRIKERQVGPVLTIYADDAPSETTFPDVEALIAPLLLTAGGSGSYDLVRG